MLATATIEPIIRSKVSTDLGRTTHHSTKYSTGVLQHFQGNPCCKHIVLGSCHDNGYVCHLDVIRSEGSSQDDITLLKSFHTGRQYDDLPFNSIRLPSLFRTQPFSATAAPPAILSTPENCLKGGITSASSEMSYVARTSASNSSSAKSVSSLLATISIHNGILVNAFDERLDKVLKKPSPTALANFHNKKRELESATDKRGPCNFHYLGSGCFTVASRCSFWHEGFDKVDISVLRWFMRSQPCDKGPECRSTSCFYGHACIACKPSCRFSSDMHGVGRTGEHEVQGED